MAKEVIRKSDDRGVDDYGYIGVRVKIMSSALLAKDVLERLLAAGSFKEFNSILAATDYGEDIAASRERLSGRISKTEILKDGIEQNFLRSIRKLRSFTGGNAAQIIDIMLSRWDIINLKAVFRGKHAGLPAIKITKYIFCCGTFERDYLEELANKKDLRCVVEDLCLMNPDMSAFLKEPFSEYLVSNNLAGLELVLDKWFYEHVLKICGRMGEGFRLLHKHIKSEIDIINIINCLRLIQAKVAAGENTAEFFISGGGKFSEKEFLRFLEGNDFAEALSWLGKKYPAVAAKIDEKNKIYVKTKDLSVFEHILKENLISTSWQMVLGETLGVKILLRYLLLKYNELKNLMLLLSKQAFGLSGNMVKEELILVKV